MSSTYDDRLAKHYQVALDLYKKFPQLGLPSAAFRDISYNFFSDNNAKEKMLATRRTLACGVWKKHVTDSYYWLESQLGDGTTVTIMSRRNEVCEEIVTGTKTEEVEAMVCPECDGKVGSDGEGGMVCLVNGRADYYARPLKKKVTLVEVPKTDWVCAPVLEAKHDLAVTS